MKILAIIQLTFRESFAKKTFIAFLGISTLVHLAFLFVLNLDIVNGADAALSIMGRDTGEVVELDHFIRIVEAAIAVALFTGGLFMALFATSSLVPSFLDKGNIDLMISKPLSRWQILTRPLSGRSGNCGLQCLLLSGHRPG